MTPEQFPKHFAMAFGSHDSAGIAGLVAEDGQILTLTGLTATGTVAVQDAFAREFAGTLAVARLVSGRLLLRPLGPGGAVLHQKYVVCGAVDAVGGEVPHFSAVLTAVVLARAERWSAVYLGFSAVTE